MRSFDRFRLDIANQCLWRGETRVSLMPKPFAVLRYLVEHPGRLVTHDQLLNAIWPDTYVQPEVLRRYILEIRRALGDNAEAPRFVQTFPKRGYQFISPVSVDDEPAANRTRIAEDIPAAATRLVGRESALADLGRYLSAALAGRRQIVFVVGEPGIGKTSLVDAFQEVASARTPVSVARGQSVEGFGGKEPYYPLLEAIGQLVRGPSRTLVVDTLVASAPTWLVQFPSLMRPQQQAALQREILGATRERMVRELCEAVETITQAIPLVLILEDLHWVDHSTLDVISAIARRRAPAKLLVVGTLRPADLILSESPLKTLKHDLLLHRLSHELELERLRESDVEDYVAAEFAPGDLPAGLASLIYRHSDGNPLFMTAMLDHLAQQGVLTEAGGRWKMTVPVEQVDPGVPETLKQMLEMQLQHATEAELQLLKCASVAGLRFTTWSIAAMLASDPGTVDGMCEALVERQQFLKAAGTRELGKGISTAEYQFRHALYREVLYRRLTTPQRVSFHLRLAESFEALHQPVIPEMAAEIALHFEEGRDYDRAVQYLIVAAENATRRYAHQQSIAVLEHARDLVPRLATDRGQVLEFQLLERIGGAYYAMGDMERSACAYEAIATRAAEAGVLAAQADALMRISHPPESIPFFLRAVEIDANFAQAYTCLSRIYSNLGETDRAKQYAQLAYKRRAQVSERERLSVTYQYHYEVTGNQSLAAQTLEEWKQAFPLEYQPPNSLAVMYNFLGSFEPAIEEGHEAVRRNPAHGYPYSNLAHAYRGAGLFDDARRVGQRAITLQVETLPTRRLLYQLAVMAGDEQAAAQHLNWARDKPREFDMIGGRAQVIGFSGAVRHARQLYAQAAEMADQRNLVDVGTSHLAWSTSMELAYGNTEVAVRTARRVIARNPSYDPRLRAALALAAAGFSQEAEAAADELAAANPEHTLINSVLVPIVRAGIELDRKRPDRAIDYLRVVGPYELGFIAALAPLHLRGLAYLMLGSGAAAAKEFQRILDCRGSDPFSPYCAVAPLGVARAQAVAGNVSISLQFYERFLAGWPEADSDVPVLLEAREEYDRLKGGTASAAVTSFSRS
jgi:DNA-binding winged helix-turn-helix (wHTH) protein/tetratricopeptide (TPR) repeat protein